MCSTIRLWRSRSVGIVPLASCALAAFAGEHVHGAGVTVTYRFNGQEEQRIALDYVGPSLAGAQYSTTLNIDGAEITWTYAIKVDAAGNRTLNGSTRLDNWTEEVATLESRAETRLCPGFIGDVMTGGTVSVKLNTHGGEGCLSPGEQPWITAAMAGESLAQGFFWKPFELCYSGGQGGPSASWGLPIPSQPLDGTYPIRALAHVVSVTVTDGDSATATMLVAANGAMETVGPSSNCYGPPGASELAVGGLTPGINAFSLSCDGDADGDGVVGADDLAELLGRWGEVACACGVDVDGDGMVGGADLSLLLAAWGECREAPGG